LLIASEIIDPWTRKNIFDGCLGPGNRHKVGVVKIVPRHEGVKGRSKELIISERPTFKGVPVVKVIPAVAISDSHS
jgi:hypothetical protein